MDDTSGNDLFDLLAQADPHLAEQMIAARLAPERAKVLDPRLALAHANFSTPTPAGQHVGGTFVASSPLEHLAAALRQGIGARQVAGVQQQREGLIGQQGVGLQAYLNAARNLGRRVPPGVGTIPAPEEM